MRHRSVLILWAAAIAIIWQLPYGRQLLYPLSLLATYAHELGHGLTALLLGNRFEQLTLHADGAGQAIWLGNPGRVATALIAAGGLMGPTLAGTALLLLSRSQRLARAVLVVLAMLMVVSVALWVRNLFGVAFVMVMAGALGLAARFLPQGGARSLLHLIAVTLCLSWFNDLGYMFSSHAMVNGEMHLSDSAVMAQALWLPFWFWGASVAVCSLAMTVLGVRVAGRQPPAAARPNP